MLIVMTTLPAVEAADSLAEQLIEEGLAGCVQILPQMTSLYMWKGAVQRDTEFLLLIKTRAEKWDQLRSYIEEHHPYETPEVVGLEPELVDPAYRAWLEDCFAGANSEPRFA